MKHLALTLFSLMTSASWAQPPSACELSLFPLAFVKLVDKALEEGVLHLPDLKFLEAQTQPANPIQDQTQIPLNVAYATGFQKLLSAPSLEPAWPTVREEIAQRVRKLEGAEAVTAEGKMQTAAFVDPTLWRRHALYGLGSEPVSLRASGGRFFYALQNPEGFLEIYNEENGDPIWKSPKPLFTTNVNAAPVLAIAESKQGEIQVHVLGYVAKNLLDRALHSGEVKLRVETFTLGSQTSKVKNVFTVDQQAVEKYIPSEVGSIVLFTDGGVLGVGKNNVYLDFFGGKILPEVFVTANGDPFLVHYNDSRMRKVSSDNKPIHLEFVRFDGKKWERFSQHEILYNDIDLRQFAPGRLKLVAYNEGYTPSAFVDLVKDFQVDGKIDFKNKRSLRFERGAYQVSNFESSDGRQLVAGYGEGIIEVIAPGLQKRPVFHFKLPWRDIEMHHTFQWLELPGGKIYLLVRMERELIIFEPLVSETPLASFPLRPNHQVPTWVSTLKQAFYVDSSTMNKEVKIYRFLRERHE